jgi:hypothetical protein
MERVTEGRGMRTYFVTKHDSGSPKREDVTETFSVYAAIWHLWIGGVNAVLGGESGDASLDGLAAFPRAHYLNAKQEEVQLVFETPEHCVYLYDMALQVLDATLRTERSEARATWKFLGNFATWAQIIHRYGFEEVMARFAMCQHAGIITEDQLMLVLRLEDGADLATSLECVAEGTYGTFENIASLFAKPAHQDPDDVAILTEDAAEVAAAV